MVTMVDTITNIRYYTRRREELKCVHFHQREGTDDYMSFWEEDFEENIYSNDEIYHGSLNGCYGRFYYDHFTSTWVRWTYPITALKSLIYIQNMVWCYIIRNREKNNFVNRNVFKKLEEKLSELPTEIIKNFILKKQHIKRISNDTKAKISRCIFDYHIDKNGRLDAWKYGAKVLLNF